MKHTGHVSEAAAGRPGFRMPDEMRGLFRRVLLLALVYFVSVVEAGGHGKEQRGHVRPKEGVSSGVPMAGAAANISSLAARLMTAVRGLVVAHHREPVDVFLQQQYSPLASSQFDDSNDGWRDRRDPGYLRWVCAEASPTGEWTLLAVCGWLDHAAHPDEGILDLYVLRADSNGALETAVSERGLASGGGTYGHPGRVSVVQMGRRQYGFKIERGVEYGGFEAGYIRIIAAGPGLIRDVAQWRTGESLDRPVECGTRGDVVIEPKTLLTSTWGFDRKNPGMKMWPLKIELRGRQDCQPLSKARTVLFDSQAGLYRMPRWELFWEND